MTQILVVVDGVTIGELFPVDFFDMEVGKAAVDVDKIRAKHAAAGGAGAYLDERPVNRLMSSVQRQFYIDAAVNKKLAAALRDVPLVVEYEGIVPVIEGTWEP
jgi:hypothetical protein